MPADSHNGSEIERIALDELHRYERNPRSHSAAQVAQIAASITEFGFTNPLLIDEGNRLIAGHGRLMAARELEMQRVPCIRLRGLSDAQKRALVIADNKLALNAGWDDELLKLELTELRALNFDLSVLGFESNELENAMGLGALFEPGGEDDQGTLSITARITCPNCGHEFQRK